MSNDEQELRAKLEARYGKVWTTTELTQDFEVLGFSHCICVVKRKADNKKGSLDFTHMPRFYYDFAEAA